MRKTTKATGETWVYEYSVYDELIRATRQSGLDAATAQESIAYVFDAMGRRHFREVRDVNNVVTGSTIWHYDGNHITHQIDVNSDGNPDEKRYTHSDKIDDVLALTMSNIDGTPQQVSLYYHKDHQGSVRALTDESGQVINEYAYSAYGIEEAAVETVVQPFRYTGREYDEETSLYHYRARAYDQVTGRFLQEDPIHFDSGDLNIYRYVGNNPVNQNDPSGLCSQYGLLAASTGGRLAAGRTATQVMLSTGTQTARFLKQAGKNSLSTIAAGGIACGMHIIAQTIEAKTLYPDAIVTIAPEKCGVDIFIRESPIPPSNIPDEDDCLGIFEACDAGNWGWGSCYQCLLECRNEGVWPYYKCDPRFGPGRSRN